MYTMVYFPRDSYHPRGQFWCVEDGDASHIMNNFASLEPPSFCVRLWVWEMPDD